MVKTSVFCSEEKKLRKAELHIEHGEKLPD